MGNHGSTKLPANSIGNILREVPPIFYSVSAICVFCTLRNWNEGIELRNGEGESMSELKFYW